MLQTVFSIFLGFWFLIGVLCIIGATNNLFMEIFVCNRNPKVYSNYAINEAEYLHKTRKSNCGGGGGPG